MPEPNDGILWDSLCKYYSQEIDCWESASRFPLGNAHYKYMQIIHRETEKIKKIFNKNNLEKDKNRTDKYAKRIAGSIDIVKRASESYLEKKEIESIDRANSRIEKDKRNLKNEAKKLASKYVTLSKDDDKKFQSMIDKLNSKDVQSKMTEKEKIHLEKIKTAWTNIKEQNILYNTLSDNEIKKYNKMLELNNLACQCLLNAQLAHKQNFDGKTAIPDTDYIKQLSKVLTQLKPCDKILGKPTFRTTITISKDILNQHLNFEFELIITLDINHDKIKDQLKDLFKATECTKTFNPEHTHLVSETGIKFGRLQSGHGILDKIVNKVVGGLVKDVMVILRVYICFVSDLAQFANNTMTLENLLKGGTINIKDANK